MVTTTSRFDSMLIRSVSITNQYTSLCVVHGHVVHNMYKFRSWHSILACRPVQAHREFYLGTWLSTQAWKLKSEFSTYVYSSSTYKSPCAIRACFQFGGRKKYYIPVWYTRQIGPLEIPGMILQKKKGLEKRTDRKAIHVVTS